MDLPAGSGTSWSANKLQPPRGPHHGLPCSASPNSFLAVVAPVAIMGLSPRRRALRDPASPGHRSDCLVDRATTPCRKTFNGLLLWHR